MTLEKEPLNWEGFGQGDVDELCQELVGEVEKEPKDFVALVKEIKQLAREKMLKRLKGKMVEGVKLDWNKILGYAEIGRYSQMIKGPRDPEVGRYLRTEEVGGKVEFFPHQVISHLARVYSEVTSRGILKLMETGLVRGTNENERALLDLGLNINIHFGRIYERQNSKSDSYPGFIIKDQFGHRWNSMPNEWNTLPEDDPDKKVVESYLLSQKDRLKTNGLEVESRYAGALLKVLQSQNEKEYQAAGTELDQAWIVAVKQTPRLVISILMERNELERSGYNRLSVEVCHKDEASPFREALEQEAARFFRWFNEDGKVKSLVPEAVHKQALEMPLIPVRIVAMSGRVWEVKGGTAQTLPDGREFEREGQATLFFEDRFDPTKQVAEGLSITSSDRVTKLVDYELGHTLSHYDEAAKATLEYTKARLFSLASLSSSTDSDLVRKRIYLFHEDILRTTNTQGEQYEIFRNFAKKLFAENDYLTGEGELDLARLADDEKNREFINVARLKLIDLLELHRRLAEEIPDEERAGLIQEFIIDL